MLPSKLVSAAKVTHLKGREVLDSRGFPTVEVEMGLEVSGKTARARAMVPSGASTGEGEALELRDGDKKRFLGKGVLKAVANVNEKIAPALLGREIARQTLLDDQLKEIDGTKNKSNLGANAILGTSMAFARTYAQVSGIPLYAYLAEMFGSSGSLLPTPMINILNGGQHADNGLEIQEFMIIPSGFGNFKEAIRSASEIFHHLKRILKAKGLSTGVGDEGGFAPKFDGDNPHDQALTAIMEAISDAGYKPGRDIFLALDSASSEFLDDSRKGDDNIAYRFEGKRLTASELIKTYVSWVESYPIISIEDGMSEHDWTGWAEITKILGGRCQLVGDDLFVTNIEYLNKGIERRVANSILIKLNQIGTLTETLETMKRAGEAGYTTVTSHRSGETEDSFIADLAVGTDSGQIKTGSVCRTDRIAKYNQLLRIEADLGSEARYAGGAPFKYGKK